MAIKPSTTYPAQTDSGSAGYPHGKARNDATPGDHSGSPWEKTHINDLWGWQQALLDAAGITPSGNADEVGASQYLEALEEVAAQIIEGGDWEVTGGNVGFDGMGVVFGSGSDVQVDGTLTLVGSDMTLALPLVCSAEGRVVKRRVAVADINADYGIQDGDIFVLADGVQSQTRTHTLNTTEAQEGDEVEFVTWDSGYSVVFNGVSHTTASGQRHASRWSYNGSSWDNIEERRNP